MYLFYLDRLLLGHIVPRPQQLLMVGGNYYLWKYSSTFEFVNLIQLSTFGSSPIVLYCDHSTLPLLVGIESILSSTITIVGSFTYQQFPHVVKYHYICFTFKTNYPIMLINLRLVQILMTSPQYGTVNDFMDFCLMGNYKFQIMPLMSYSTSQWFLIGSVSNTMLGFFRYLNYIHPCGGHP